MAEVISTAVALAAAFVLGYGLRGEREAQADRQRRRIGDPPPAMRNYTDTFLDPNLLDPKLVRQLRREARRR